MISNPIARREEPEPSGASRAPIAEPARRSGALYLASLAAVLFLATASGRVTSTDVQQEMAVAKSLVVHGSVAIPPLPGTAPGLHGAYSVHGLGESLLMLPVAALDAVLPAASSDSTMGYGVSLVNALIAALIVFVFVRFELDLGVRRRPALIAGVVLMAGTMVWPYAHQAFDVLPTALLVLTGWCAAHRAGQQDQWWWRPLSGIAFAVAILFRAETVLWLPIVALYVLSERGSTRARMTRLLVWSVPLGMGLAVVAGYNLTRFGDAFESGRRVVPYADFATPILTGGAGLLASPGKGLLWYCPALALAALGTRAFFLRNGRLAIALLSGGIVFVALYGTYSSWPGEESWGPRFLVPLVPLAMVSAGFALNQWPRIPAALRLVCVVAVLCSAAVQVVGASLDLHQQELLMVSHQDYGRYWSIGSSPILAHARSLASVVEGGPADYGPQPAGESNPGAPRIPDFWWAHAWGERGRQPFVVANLALLGGLGWVASSRLLAEIRPT